MYTKQTQIKISYCTCTIEKRPQDTCWSCCYNTHPPSKCKMHPFKTKLKQHACLPSSWNSPYKLVPPPRSLSRNKFDWFHHFRNIGINTLKNHFIPCLPKHPHHPKPNQFSNLPYPHLTHSQAPKLIKRNETQLHLETLLQGQIIGTQKPNLRKIKALIK